MKNKQATIPKKYAIVIVTVTTFFEDSIFYKPAETYTIRTSRQWDVNEEIARFFKRIGKREGKGIWSPNPLGRD